MDREVQPEAGCRVQVINDRPGTWSGFLLPPVKLKAPVLKGIGPHVAGSHAASKEPGEPRDGRTAGSGGEPMLDIRRRALIARPQEIPPKSDGFRAFDFHRRGVAVISTSVGESLTLNLERKLMPSRPSTPFPNGSPSSRMTAVA